MFGPPSFLRATCYVLRATCCVLRWLGSILQLGLQNLSRAEPFELQVVFGGGDQGGIGDQADNLAFQDSYAVACGFAGDQIEDTVDRRFLEVGEVDRHLGDPPILEHEPHGLHVAQAADRKSTRLNSSHSQISYAVFCLKKKKNNKSNQ